LIERIGGVGEYARIGCLPISVYARFITFTPAVAAVAESFSLAS
jgi:hypothetical protein